MISMRHAVCASLLMFVFAAGMAGAAEKPGNKAIDGIWLGTIKVPGVELRIAFEISEAKEGGYTAKMHSIDQSAMNIPVSAVIQNGDSLRLEIKSFSMAYEGKLLADGTTIEGNWLQGGATALVMKRVDKLPEFNRPQTPKKPYPYTEEEVSYENIKAGVKLAATLTIPQGNGPFPAVVLLTGSGPENRDEEAFFHHPFLVLADYLTRRGIAVLRADDRGVGGSTGNGDFTKVTSGDSADDAIAGIDFLKGRKEIDKKRIGLLGHSEGGTIGPIAITRSLDVAFLVMLAGPGQTFADIVIFQKLLAARARGVDEGRLALMRSWYERLYSTLAEDTDNAVAEKKVRALHASLTAEEKEKLDWPDGRLNGEMKLMLSPWWRYSMKYNPRATLMKVKCPVLAINGEKDMQVTAKENLAAIEEALKSGGNKHVTVRELPGLNHLFQTCETGAESEYIKIEETMSLLALQAIGDWINGQTGVGGNSR